MPIKTALSGQDPVEKMTRELQKLVVEHLEREHGLELVDRNDWGDAFLLEFVVPGTRKQFEVGVWDTISDEGTEMDFDWTISDGGRDLDEGYGTWVNGRGLFKEREFLRTLSDALMKVKEANRRSRCPNCNQVIQVR